MWALPRESAGLLLYRFVDGQLQVLLVHPGGPFWARRSEGAWSLPKGEVDAGESPLQVAKREFKEELGADPPESGYVSLGSVRQAGGKLVHAWAASGDIDVTRLESNTFEIEWPPRSGRMQTFPEVDKAEWFDPATAEKMILAGQRPLIGRVREALPN